MRDLPSLQRKRRRLKKRRLKKARRKMERRTKTKRSLRMLKKPRNLKMYPSQY